MKMNLAVFFGCASVEHEISVISAVQAMASMDTEKYNVIPVYVSKKRDVHGGGLKRTSRDIKISQSCLKAAPA